MGMHWFKPPSDFNDVAHVMGTYDGVVTYFEVMSTPDILHGAQDDMKYINQTMMNLPSGYVYDMTKNGTAVDHMTVTIYKQPSATTTSNGASFSMGTGFSIGMAMLAAFVQLLV
eukprot:4591821-Pyramimonas_sp.AAC.1